MNQQSTTEDADSFEEIKKLDNTFLFENETTVKSILSHHLRLQLDCSTKATNRQKEGIIYLKEFGVLGVKLIYVSGIIFMLYLFINIGIIFYLKISQDVNNNKIFEQLTKFINIEICITIFICGLFLKLISLIILFIANRKSQGLESVETYLDISNRILLSNHISKNITDPKIKDEAHLVIVKALLEAEPQKQQDMSDESSNPAKDTKNTTNESANKNRKTKEFPVRLKPEENKNSEVKN